MKYICFFYLQLNYGNIWKYIIIPFIIFDKIKHWIKVVKVRF
jgi:hypothetical protein